MNQELSTTEAKLIEQAAKKHAEGTCTGKQYGGTTDLIVPKIKEWAAYDFEAGIDYALSHILPSRMIGFVECSLIHYFRLGRNKWGSLGGHEYTTAELYQKYNEYLKQQDGK